MSVTHELKCWPEYFRPIADGRKSFDLRKADRDFKVGDNVRLMEWEPKDDSFTGQDCYRHIVYILAGVGPGCIAPLRGLAYGYVILGFAPHAVSPVGAA